MAALLVIDRDLAEACGDSFARWSAQLLRARAEEDAREERLRTLLLRASAKLAATLEDPRYFPMAWHLEHLGVELEGAVL